MTITTIRGITINGTTTLKIMEPSSYLVQIDHVSQHIIAMMWDEMSVNYPLQILGLWVLL